jgi:hypothetical protein
VGHSSNTDTSIAVAVTKKHIAKPRIIRSALYIQASVCAAHRQLDSTGLRGGVRRLVIQLITRHLQFAQEHDTCIDNQWTRVLFVDDTYLVQGVSDQIRIKRFQEAVL